MGHGWMHTLDERLTRAHDGHVPTEGGQLPDRPRSSPGACIVVTMHGKSEPKLVVTRTILPAGESAALFPQRRHGHCDVRKV